MNRLFVIHRWTVDWRNKGDFIHGPRGPKGHYAGHAIVTTMREYLSLYP